jgi:hypothetical protein
MPKSTPLPDCLKDQCVYDPVTGLIDQPDKKKTGRPSLNNNGYAVVNITVDGTPKRFLAHRVAWFLHYGTDPGVMQVDHINGNRADNRIENLRLVSHAENCHNQAVSTSRKKTGLPLGVYLAANGGFRASITVDGREQYLGVFDTPDQASNAYVSAKLALQSGAVASRFKPVAIVTGKRKRSGYSYRPDISKSKPWYVQCMGSWSAHASELEAQIEVARLRSGHPAVMSR